MIVMMRLRGMFVLCAIVVISASSFAGFVPDWRGDLGSTYQEWQFNTGENPTAPDIDENSYGFPEAKIGAGDPSGMEWLSSDRGHDGVWKTDGYIELYIPNAPNNAPDSYKIIFIQMIFDAGANSDAWVRYSADGLPLSPGIAPIESVDLGDGYRYGLWKIEITPNPTEETIYTLPFYCDLFADSIIVDTICIPEPATMAILGLGSLLVIRRKRA